MILEIHTNVPLSSDFFAFVLITMMLKKMLLLYRVFHWKGNYR